MVTIAYPLQAPAIAGIGPQDFTLALENLVGENVSPFTFGEQEFLWPGDMFTIDASLPPMLYQQAEQWISFLALLYGKYGTFLMGDYNRPTPQGPMSGVSGGPVTNGATLSGATQINLRNCTPDIFSWVVAGDYIQVAQPGGGTKRLHKVLAPGVTDSEGNIGLLIRPAIREGLTDGTPIVTSNCVGTFRLSSNKCPWKIDKNGIYTIAFQAREAGLV